MKDLIDDGIPIYADSAEPKSVAEIQRLGYYIDGASKGPDSVRNGIDWLLSKNVYVTSRSMNLWNEQANYTWLVTRQGRTEPKPIDDYNHCIDAIRYGAHRWIESTGGKVATEFTAADLGL